MKPAVLILIIIGFCFNAYSQKTLSISGEVSDENHNTLPGATAFLTNTKNITACANDGKFTLNNLNPGSYQLVVKMIGYAPFIKSINLTDEIVQVKIELKPEKLLLKEVKIRPDYDREKHLALFKKEFLGLTYNAKLCKIINPESLYFNYDKKLKTLSAVTDEFLIVQNNALGYEVKYLLTDFQYNESTPVVTFQGYPSFKEISGTPQQETLWNKNRKIAYLGSINHFIKAVYNNRVFEEGFITFKILNRPMQGLKSANGKKTVLINKIIAFDSLVTVVNKDLKSFTFKDCLYVVYTKEKEPDAFKEYSYNVVKEPSADIPKGQVSLVYLLSDSINLDANGLYDPANGLFFEGYWAWGKIADLMPIDYQ